MHENIGRANARETWRLEDLYAQETQWEEDMVACAASVAAFAEYQGKLGDRATCKRALDSLFGMTCTAERLYSYAHMRRDEDNAQAKYQAMTDRAQALLVEIDTASAFVLPELMRLDAAYLQALANDPEFVAYDRFIADALRHRPHTLSAEEERIIAMAGEMADAPDTVFTMLTDADMVFPEIENEHGEKIRLTQSGYLPLMLSKDRRVRRDAFHALYHTFAGYRNTIGALYAASVKADAFHAKTAKFDSALNAALFPDEIPDAVYTRLIEETHRHIPQLNEYLRINAALLGVHDMQMYDIYASPVEGFSVDLPFDEAYQLVVDCLGVLGDDYVETLKDARRAGWIDPYENAGKHSGAYSWGAYGAHPYVLLNYHENLDGLMTVAHEMGHAMHTFYSNARQPYPKAGYSLFVAEVASTVNEVLVLTKLTQMYPDKAAQAYLTHQLLDTYRTTLFRQTMFAEFEMRAHRLYESGEALTHERLSEMYGELNALYYPACAQNPEIRHEWMRIPHFYRAFYVYKYATGFAAATAIARMLMTEGEPAAKRYRAFLSAGSSMSPIDALRLAGVDMESPEPVEKALQLFDETVEKYRSLTV